MVDSVAMQIRSIAAPLAGDSLGEHLNDFVETLPLEIAVGISASHGFIQSVLRPVLSRAHRYDLLGQNVHRRIRNDDAIQIAQAYRANQRRVLDKIVARRGKEAPFRNRPPPVASPPTPLHTHPNPPPQPPLAAPTHPP